MIIRLLNTTIVFTSFCITRYLFLQETGTRDISSMVLHNRYNSGRDIMVAKGLIIVMIVLFRTIKCPIIYGQDCVHTRGNVGAWVTRVLFLSCEWNVKTRFSAGNIFDATHIPDVTFAYIQIAERLSTRKNLVFDRERVTLELCEKCFLHPGFPRSSINLPFTFLSRDRLLAGERVFC